MDREVKNSKPRRPACAETASADAAQGLKVGAEATESYKITGITVRQGGRHKT
jgi:hypothetical protein